MRKYTQTCILGAGAKPIVPEEAEPGLSAVAVNSPDPAGPALMFTATEWAAFTTGVRDGEFD
jgi:hypothetical protein